MKKLIDLNGETTRSLNHLAVDNDMMLKPFIELQLDRMGTVGIPYIDLLKENELLLIKLKQLSK